MQDPMLEIIKTPTAAIDALGGLTKVAAMFAAHERVTPGAVWNWRKRGIPAKAWRVLAPELERIGRFSPQIFDMLEPNHGGQGGRKRRQGRSA